MSLTSAQPVYSVGLFPEMTRVLLRHNIPLDSADGTGRLAWCPRGGGAVHSSSDAPQIRPYVGRSSGDSLNHASMSRVMGKFDPAEFVSGCAVPIWGLILVFLFVKTSTRLSIAAGCGICLPFGATSPPHSLLSPHPFIFEAKKEYSLP